MERKQPAAYIAYMGIVLAVSLILGYIEWLLPLNLGIPGIKLGLPNLSVVYLLYIAGWREALCVNIIRIILSGLLFGNMSMILYSLCGAGLSFICMLLVKRSGRFSSVGVSIMGGVTHNLGQLMLAALLIDVREILFYGPVLIVGGALAGALMGFVSLPVIKNIKPLGKTD